MNCFCSNCGNEIPDGARFCTVCGETVENVQPKKTTYSQPVQITQNYQKIQYPQRVMQNITKRQKVGIAAIISAGLAFIMLFMLVIGPFISKQANSVRWPDTGKVTASGSAAVSPDNPVAKIGKVTVDLKDNLNGQAKLTVQTGSQQPQSEQYTAIDVYDFSLEGQIEFDTLIDISLPNTAEENEAFHVSFYNEENGEWEKLPYETSGDEVSFSTTHFSTYGLIRYNRNRYVGPLTPLVVNYDELRKALKNIEDDNLFEQFLEQKGQVGANEWVKKGMSLFNDATGYVSIPPTYGATVGLEDSRVLADKLAAVGGTVTFLKMAYQWQSGDSNKKILEDNIFDLCELSLSGAAMAIPASTLLPVAAMGIFTLGLAYEYVLVPAYQDDSLQYAYRTYHDYCMYPNIAYDKERAKALADGMAEETPWVALQVYNKDKKKWELVKGGAMLEQSFSNKWKNALMDSYTLYVKDPKAMQGRIDALIEEYLDAFWALKGTEQVQFAKDFCGIDEKDWRWPDEVEIRQMKDAVKAELMRDLKPVFEDVQSTVLEDMKKSLIRDTDALVEYLNTEISFVIVDPEAKKEGFENTRVAKDIIRIETVSDSGHKDDWICQPEKWSGDAIFSCTLYNYLKEGCPAEACFYKTEADLKAGTPYMKAPFTVTMPVTTITLGQNTGFEGKYSLSTQFIKTGEWSYSDSVQAMEGILYQAKDLEVKTDGTFSVNIPAKTVTLKHYYAGSLTDTAVSFGTITLKGQIDPKTGQGVADFSGSATGSWASGSYSAESTITLSGNMAVAYNSNRNGLIFTSSPAAGQSIKASGTEVFTWNQEGEKKVDTKNIDEMINNAFYYDKQQ